MAEILHQLIGNLSHYLLDFMHARWCRISSINSIASLEMAFWEAFIFSPDFPKVVDVALGNIYGQPGSWGENCLEGQNG